MQKYFWLTGVASHQRLCHLYPISIIVPFVLHINHCVVCTLCQPLCRLYPISTIVLFVPHISRCVPHINHCVVRAPYQPLCCLHPISAFVYPISAIVSFVPLSAIVHNYGSLKYLGHEIREKNYLDFHTSKSIIVVQLCVIKTPRAWDGWKMISKSIIVVQLCVVKIPRVWDKGAKWSRTR